MFVLAKGQNKQFRLMSTGDEDDYMSEKFLVEKQEDVKPISSSLKRRYAIASTFWLDFQVADIVYKNLSGARA